MYSDANNLSGWEIPNSLKLPINGFKWEENIHKFMKTS